VIRSAVLGSEAEVICRVVGSQRSMRALINTAYIERLNATFRARLAPMARRSRSAQAPYARSGNVVGRDHLQPGVQAPLSRRGGSYPG
jgi:hypothetical protein